MATRDAAWFRETYTAIRSEIGKAVVGQDEVVESVLVGMAADAHILLEGMPGLGKTLLVRALSQVLELRFSRIQFTPDMMPADVTGTNVLSADGTRRNEFRRGPIFANILLADEINRATPKTQSAMLEAMQERAVTVGGVRHELESPFLVMATQNPIEQEGTYPLPEAQLDRFLLKVLVPFPSKEELATIVKRTTGTLDAELSKVADADAVLGMRKLVR
ncbi:MAG TPA: AAA family ATPase, partial [Fimbriimonadaceae bacterium]|nr:AAA family ATPase [Fimbriimonadaceae bacterium]